MTTHYLHMTLVGVYGLTHPNSHWFKPFAEWILTNHNWKSIVPEDKGTYEEWTNLLKTKLDTLYPLFWTEFSKDS